MKKQYKQIILGGGASGLMLASLLRAKAETLVLEGNPDMGAKIAISGGGRCNITNAQVGGEHYVGERHFVQKVLASFDQKSVLKWFSDRGLNPVIEKKSQYFCPSSSQEVLTVFRRATKGAALRTSCRIIRVEKHEETFAVVTDQGEYRTQRLIVATGGMSFPRLGASDIGYRIAEVFGHTMVPIAPALTGMTLQPEQFFFKALSGLSTEVVITVGEERIRESLLFAHKGISGPAVLDASLYWQKGKISIDFLPDFDLKSLQKSKRQISTLLPLPKRLAKAFLAHLSLKDKPGNSMGIQEREKLERLHAYCFAPAGTFGYGKAEVTRGGVSTSSIDPNSMESRQVRGLYFIGEVLDVTGRLGGYNFQWAFSSAAVCANAINALRDV
jgi:predicted Rossmann fold flavoprotein